MFMFTTLPMGPLKGEVTSLYKEFEKKETVCTYTLVHCISP